MESAEFGAGSHQASMAKGDLSHCHSAFCPDLGVSPRATACRRAEGHQGGGWVWMGICAPLTHPHSHLSAHRAGNGGNGPPYHQRPERHLCKALLHLQLLLQGGEQAVLPQLDIPGVHKLL